MPAAATLVEVAGRDQRVLRAGVSVRIAVLLDQSPDGRQPVGTRGVGVLGDDTGSSTPRCPP